jgi:hypothetical protein
MKSSVVWDCHLLSRWFLAWHTLRPWRWRRHVPPKRRLIFNGLCGVKTQKIQLFYVRCRECSFYITGHRDFLQCCCLLCDLVNGRPDTVYRNFQGKKQDSWQMYPSGASGLHEDCVLYRKARRSTYSSITWTTASKAVLLQHYDTVGDMPLLVARIVLVALSQAVNSMQILA